MTNKKSTKRALLSSVLALVLCLTMFIGTTFAWFTDSVTSGKNQIVAGNLDIELEYSNDMENWKTVKDSSEIFKPGALWEPGYTEVVYLRLTNKGTLDLKYQFGMNIYSEKDGVNQAGETFKLSDYIEFGVQENITAEYADRAAARAAVTDAKIISAGYSKTGTMEAGTDAKCMALVVYMPETVGNVANHNGETIPEIELGLNVVATQLASEFDSFDENYDKYAIYSDYQVDTQEELDVALAAAKDGDVIAISPGLYNLNRQVNGVTLVGVSDGVQLYNTCNYASNGAIGALWRNMTYQNVSFTNTVWTQGDGAYATFVDVTFEKGFRNGYARDVKFDGCTFYPNDAGYSMHFGEVYEKVTVTDSTFYLGTIALGDDGEGLATFDNCTFDVSGTPSGDGYVALWADALFKDCEFSASTEIKVNKSEDGDYHVATLENTTNAVVMYSGVTVTNGIGQDASGNYYVYTAEGLASLNAAMQANKDFNKITGRSYNICADIDATGTTWTTVSLTTGSIYNSGIVFDGQGHTISNLTISGRGLFNHIASGSAETAGPTTVKNLTVANAKVEAADSKYHVGVIWGQVYGKLVLDNVHVLNADVTGDFNVGGLVGRNGDQGYSSITFNNCSVKDSTITANGTPGDPVGANAFLGATLKLASTGACVDLTFTGENVSSGNEITNTNKAAGGGIYATSDTANWTVAGSTVVNEFANFSNK